MKHPLAEVFGFPCNNCSTSAKRYRKNKLCPFGNRVPNCTKDKADNPLGVCSIFEKDKTVITCPVRFREEWLIAEHAAAFFFPPDTQWTTLTEVRLNDAQGKSAGNIDVVLAAYDHSGRVTDFGALEVQAVYISGNVRNPFEAFLKRPNSGESLDWTDEPLYPRPDYLSSSRKRLAPQLIFKGGILRAWNKKMAVAMDRRFYETLPELAEAPSTTADMAWLVYELQYHQDDQRFHLVHHQTIYTEFEEALLKITTSKAGEMDDFMVHLQTKLDEKLEEGFPPENHTIGERH